MISGCVCPPTAAVADTAAAAATVNEGIELIPEVEAAAATSDAWVKGAADGFSAYTGRPDSFTMSGIVEQGQGVVMSLCVSVSH